MTNKTEEKKELLIVEFTKTRDQIMQTAALIPVELENEVFLGTWTIKDLYTHFCGWDHTNISAIREILHERLPSFYAQKDPDWRRYNAYLIHKHGKKRFRDILHSVCESFQSLKELLESIPAKELYRDRGIRYRGYKVLISRLIEAEIRDEKTHYQQLKQFLDCKGLIVNT